MEDYLLGVSDEGRSGGLRLRKEPEGAFRAEEHDIPAMTALTAQDGDESAGFLDLAEFIAGNSCRPAGDLHELFRRIAFSICISNTDCHLRNHAFLLASEGWGLSPAYDLNPSVEKDHLALNITDTESDIDLRLLLSTAEFYRLHESEAREEIIRIQNVVAGWRKAAARNGISESEMNAMAPAFGEADRRL